MKAWLRRYWKVLAAGCVFALLVLIYLGFRYRGHVSSAFGWISEETGGRTMAILTIVLTLCGLAYGLFCLIFPLIVCRELRYLRRRTVQIERTIQECAELLQIDRHDAVNKPNRE